MHYELIGGLIVRIFLVLLGTLQITAYRPVSWQTKATCLDRHHCETSTGENVSELGLAVSQDLLLSGKVKYGDIICVETYPCRIVFDTMAQKNHNAIDLFVYTKAEEKAVGVRHLRVWIVKRPS
jgi:3D (Asp-Asp-Asp) domain-containing protein